MMKLYKIAGALTLLLLAGCATQQPTPEMLARVGNPVFFSDPAALKPLPDNADIKVYKDPQLTQDSKDIRTLYIEPVQVWLDPTSEYKLLSDEDVNNITTKLRQAYQNASWQRYPLVTSPAPHSLKVKLAVTHTKLTKDRTRLVSFTPVGLVAKGIKLAAGVSPVNVVSFGFSAEGTSPSGKVLFMVELMPTAAQRNPDGTEADEIRQDELPARLLDLVKEVLTNYGAPSK
jgi:hypothetical protein